MKRRRDGARGPSSAGGVQGRREAAFLSDRPTEEDHIVFNSAAKDKLEIDP